MINLFKRRIFMQKERHYIKNIKIYTHSYFPQNKFVLKFSKINLFQRRDFIMKKKCMVALLTAVMSVSICSSAFAEAKIEIDGRSIITDTPPIISKGRTFVPMRSIFEALGANIIWTDTSKSVLATLGDKKVFITVGDSLAFINDSPVSLDTPAQIVNDRVLVPVRFVSEALGYTVDWNNSTQTVSINSSNTNETNIEKNTTDPIDNILPATGTRPEVDTTPDGNNVKTTGEFSTKGKLVGNKFVGKVFAYYTNTKQPVFYGELTENFEYTGECYIFENDYYLKATFENGIPVGKGTFYYNSGYYTVEYENGQIKDGEYSVYDYDNNYIGSMNYNNGELGIYSLTKSLYY